ncbi:hypothetical protein Vretimale_11392 [Volvox reticuliferus]|uniref:non-specific serine/threonine protein kinase n=1 Tax=Volvox reticuliferus TaxID=1737510 RepID=A0A8J4LQX5_9CHLO|nr:hypothetical protein Vretifemale_11934 [Volvox reticuliferus]GIM07278.1 hypothetical protein Vretimale_11392 [Volvox reticuliferus]
MAESIEAGVARLPETDVTSGALESYKLITFLGRPAIVLTLGTGGGPSSGERSHKRSRPNDAGDLRGGDGAPGGIRQVVRSMLRAQKLGVLVPLVYDADVVSGVAVMEAVAGPRLRDLLAAAVAGSESGSASRPEPEQVQEQQQVVEPSAAAADAAASAAGTTASKPLPPELDRTATLLGRTLAKLHDGGQVHNNLSGATVVLRENDGAVVLTGFSRSFNTIVALDKAQDLAALETALLEEAAAAQQPQRAVIFATQVFDKVLSSYRSSSHLWSATHNKLADVRRTTGARQQEQQHQHATKRAKRDAEEDAAEEEQKEDGATCGE